MSTHAGTMEAAAADAVTAPLDLLLRRVLQAYLGAAQTAEGVVVGADLDWADAEQVGFTLTNLVDALGHAEGCRGSWWPDYAAWLAEHCGEETAAPDELGGGGLAPLCGAPGTYVYDR